MGRIKMYVKYKILEKTGKNEPQWTLGFCNCRCTRSWRGNFYRKYTFHTIISRKHTMANGGRTGLCICLFTDLPLVFRTGYSYMLLNMARDREVSLGNLLYLFHNGPDRVLVAGFILSLLNTVAQLPFLLCIVYGEVRKYRRRTNRMGRAVSCDASGWSCSGGNPDEPVYADFLSACRQSGNGRE